MKALSLTLLLLAAATGVAPASSATYAAIGSAAGAYLRHGGVRSEIRIGCVKVYGDFAVAQTFGGPSDDPVEAAIILKKTASGWKGVTGTTSAISQGKLVKLGMTKSGAAALLRGEGACIK